MAKRQTRRSHFSADERGVSAIEFGLILPIIVLMSIATLDLGHGLYRSMQVQNAAHVGAQFASMRGFDQAQISQVVTGSTGFNLISAAPAPKQFCGCSSAGGVVEIDCKSKCAGGAAPGTYVTVSAQGTYQTLIPYPILPSSYQLNSQSTVRVQ